MRASTIQQAEWWRDFFSGLTVEMWRLAMSEEQTRKEADFIQKIFPAPPASLLDVPCGNGRHSIELASRGYTMTGVDISPEFLAAARSGSAGRNLPITWELREMRELPRRNTFDGAFCLGNSFGYLDDKGNLDFLKAVHRALAPGRRFALDASSVAENVLPKVQGHTEMRIGDILFIEDNHYDSVSSRLETDYTFVRGDRAEKRFGSHRIYTFCEFETLLSEAGFVGCRALGDLDGSPVQSGDESLFFVASRG